MVGSLKTAWKTAKKKINLESGKSYKVRMQTPDTLELEEL